MGWSTHLIVLISWSVPTFCLLIIFLLLSFFFIVSDKEKKDVSPKDLQEVFNNKYSMICFDVFIFSQFRTHSCRRVKGNIMHTLVSYKGFNSLYTLWLVKSIGLMTRKTFSSIWREQWWCSGESSHLPPMCPGFNFHTRCQKWLESVNNNNTFY